MKEERNKILKFWPDLVDSNLKLMKIYIELSVVNINFSFPKTSHVDLNNNNLLTYFNNQKTCQETISNTGI